MGSLPCGWLFSGRNSFPRGTGSRSETPHAPCVLHPESLEGTRHFLQSGVRQLMLWRENGAKIPLIKSCKGLFPMQGQRYTLWLKIPVCWMMFTRKEHLRRLFLWKLRAKTRMFVCYIPVSLTWGIHSKQHDVVEVSYSILSIANGAEQQPAHCLTKEAESVRV